MVATHSAGLELMRRALAAEQDPRAVEGQARQAVRLLGLFGRQLELMARQRGRQRRRVSIRHERVVEGGKVSVQAETEQLR